MEAFTFNRNKEVVAKDSSIVVPFVEEKVEIDLGMEVLLDIPAEHPFNLGIANTYINF